MKKLKHTPGPWRKQGNLILGYNIGVSVAKIFTKHIPGELSGAAEESANARLIAAAPELLEILEEFLQALDVEGLDEAMKLGLDTTVISAREVARKARGEL